ncbi:ABC transporter permease [Uliginosibacterium sp. 31-16]|uniref:ABC transporter permease n=1 Tax=Uliginosibacterium sp. 31-16 TaxID=3068315 RepID=UPI00273F6DD2|nr:ABC transporter permease [Uliginosibacterium sp. 31-16]MDP5240935.1 ABC transporter permease [Uliginosibacterium sp. 31-16]
MLNYIFKRMLSAIPFMFMVSLTVFILIQLPPGDFVDSYAAAAASSGETISPEKMADLRHQFGLDRHILIQYFYWIGGIVTGNFGYSFEWQSPVKDLVGERIGLTLILSVAAMLFTWALALPIGVYSAVKRYSIGDYFFTFVGFIGLAVPNFLLALVMMFIASKYYNQDVTGLFSPEFQSADWSLARVYDLMHHLWIPMIIMGAASSAGLIRILRANLIDQLYMPYVVTARSKGLSEVKLLIKYPVRIALNPFVSSIGWILPNLVSGAVIISIVLNLPTVGPMLYQSLMSQDIYLSGTILLVVCLLTVVGTLLSDILLVILDPRIRLEQ